MHKKILGGGIFGRGGDREYFKLLDRIIYKGWIQRYSDVFKTLVVEKESRVLNLITLFQNQ